MTEIPQLGVCLARSAKTRGPNPWRRTRSVHSRISWSEFTRELRTESATALVVLHPWSADRVAVYSADFGGIDCGSSCSGFEFVREREAFDDCPRCIDQDARGAWAPREEFSDLSAKKGH